MTACESRMNDKKENLAHVLLYIIWKLSLYIYLCENLCFLRIELFLKNKCVNKFKNWIHFVGLPIHHNCVVLSSKNFLGACSCYKGYWNPQQYLWVQCQMHLSRQGPWQVVVGLRLIVYGCEDLVWRWCWLSPVCVTEEQGHQCGSGLPACTFP